MVAPAAGTTTAAVGLKERMRVRNDLVLGIFHVDDDFAYWYAKNIIYSVYQDNFD